MKRTIPSAALAAMLAVNASAQFPATITITDGSSGAPLENASVVLDGNTVATDASGHAVFNGLADATYDFSVSASCYSPGGGSITIAGAAASASLGLEAMATNNLFWYIGDPLAITGASVHVYNGTGYDTTFVTWDFFGGEMLGDVPFGTVDYTITTPCYETVSGTVTVDCNNGEGIAVFTNPAPMATNNLFWYIGDPLAITGASVHVYNGTGYDTTFVTWDFFGGEMLADVPFGTVDYTITTPCYETVSGTVTVDCNNGEGIAVFTNPAPMATNNLFWYIGDPLAITGASVHVYNGTGYDTTFVTWDFFGGEMLADVPFGTMDYTITTPCYETVSGTVTVDCNNGEGIAVFTNPAPVVIDATVTVAGNTLTASAAGMEYQWVDCNNGNAPISGATGQSFTPAESGSYAVVITGQDCPVTSACSSMVITGLDELVAGRDFTAFPVPFNEQLAVGVNNGAGPVEVGLFNMVGQRVLQASSMGDQLVVSTAHLPAGSYLLRIRAGGSLGTVHIVK